MKKMDSVTLYNNWEFNPLALSGHEVHDEVT
jgi:hypothetical protein